MEWELTLKPNKMYEIRKEFVLRVTHALLISGDIANVTWSCGDQKNKFLCRLTEQNRERTDMALNFMKNDKIQFVAMGNATIMLFGFMPTAPIQHFTMGGQNFLIAKQKLAAGEDPTNVTLTSGDDLRDWLRTELYDSPNEGSNQTYNTILSIIEEEDSSDMPIDLDVYDVDGAEDMDDVEVVEGIDDIEDEVD